MKRKFLIGIVGLLVMISPLKTLAAESNTDTTSESVQYEIYESENLDNNKKTTCYSSWDSNSDEYCGFDTMSSKTLNKMYRKHRIWVPGISVKQNKKRVTIKYQSVPGASGYQIRYSTKISKKWTDKATIKKYETMTIKKTKVVLKRKNNKVLYVQIRPFKVISNKTIYGKWSSIYAYDKDEHNKISSAISMKIAK